LLKAGNEITPSPPPGLELPLSGPIRNVDGLNVKGKFLLDISTADDVEVELPTKNRDPVIHQFTVTSNNRILRISCPFLLGSVYF
jgi:hypothetical protein